jgi:RAD3-like DEAD/DEAH box helicase
LRDFINKFNRQNQKGPPLHGRASGKKGKKIPRNEHASAASVGAELKARWDVSQFKVQPAQGKTRFHDFDLPSPLLHAISDLGFKYCTPIQAKILPSSLSGKDASGRAQTGTGKTAAFLITVITRMLNKPIRDKRKPGTPRILVLGKLVTQLRRTSQEVAKSQGLGLVICDGSPGIGCPVIASLTGASLALIVVEPTMSGLHDFSRIAQLASRLAVPSMMVVNKADLNPKVADQLETEAKKHAVEPIGRVPYDPAITQAQVAKKSIVEFGDGPAAQAIRDLWDRVADRLPSFATAQAGGLMQIDV